MDKIDTRPRNARAFLRRLGLSHIVMVVALLVILIFFRPKPLDEFSFTELIGLGLPIVIFLSALIDCLVVGTIASDIASVTDMDVVYEVFVRGTGWKEIFALHDELMVKALQKINSRELAESEREEFERAEAERRESRRIALERANERSVQRRQARAHAGQVALLEQAAKLGIPEGEMHEAITSGTARVLIASCHDVRVQRERAQRLGLLALVEIQLGERDVRAAKVALDSFEALLSEAGRLGVREEVQSLGSRGLVCEARACIQSAKMTAQHATAIVQYQRRIESLPAELRPKPRTLLSSLEGEPYGSRGFRKAAHDLEKALS